MENISNPTDNLFSKFSKAIESHDKKTLQSLSMNNKEEFNSYLNEKENGITRYNRIMGGTTITENVKQFIGTFYKNIRDIFSSNTTDKITNVATVVSNQIKPRQINDNFLLEVTGKSYMSPKMSSSVPFSPQFEKISNPVSLTQSENFVQQNLVTTKPILVSNIPNTMNSISQKTSPITNSQQVQMNRMVSMKTSPMMQNKLMEKTSPVTSSQRDMMQNVSIGMATSPYRRTDDIIENIRGQINNMSQDYYNSHTIMGNMKGGAGKKKKQSKMTDLTGNKDVRRTRTNYKLIDSFNRYKNEESEEMEGEDIDLSRATPEQDEKYKNLVTMIMEVFSVDEFTAKAYRFAFKNYVVTNNEELKKDEDKKTEEIEKVIKNKKLAKKIIDEKKTEIDEMAEKIKNRPPPSENKKKQKNQKKPKTNELNYLLSEEHELDE